MAASLLGVGLLAYWDAHRESQAALDDFGNEQSTVAAALATALQARSNPAGDVQRVFERLRPLERPGTMVLLLEAEGTSVWTSTYGARFAIPPIDEAAMRGEHSVRLSREQSAALGLPARMSIAGTAVLDAGSGGHFTIAAVTTAQRLRDREFRAKNRLVLGVVLAAGLVLAFGGHAMRKQRKELELASSLLLAEATRERDERLVRADKLAMMGALATGIAHEVSTPLGVIVGRAEQLLLTVEGDDRARRCVEAILEQGERISRVIRGFLLMARGDAPTFERTSTASIARKSLELVEHRFGQAGVSLRGDIQEAVAEIACEPRLIEQAIANLLLNACDACERGGDVVLAVEEQGERVRFVVTDNGSGIPKAIASRVMDPFFTTKPSGKGVGLGLAIAAEIVSHHHGTLTIDSREAAGLPGTRASIELPVARRES